MSFHNLVFWHFQNIQKSFAQICNGNAGIVNIRVVICRFLYSKAFWKKIIVCGVLLSDPCGMKLSETLGGHCRNLYNPTQCEFEWSFHNFSEEEVSWLAHWELHILSTVNEKHLIEGLGERRSTPFNRFVIQRFKSHFVVCNSRRTQVWQGKCLP